MSDSTGRGGKDSATIADARQAVIAPSVPSESTARTSAVARWIVDTSRAGIEDGLTVTMRAVATGASGTARLFVRCRAHRVSVYFSAWRQSQPVDGDDLSTRLRIRVDSAETVSEYWARTRDGNDVYSRKPEALLERMAGAQRFRIEWTPAGASPELLEWPLGPQFSGALNQLRPACE